MGIGLLSRCVMEGIHVLFLSCLIFVSMTGGGGLENSRKNPVFRAARTQKIHKHFFFNNIIFKTLCGNDDRPPVMDEKFAP